MSEQHGAAVIKEFMQDLVELARSGRDFTTSAGAEPGRTYAYLEYHLSEEQHSLLLFRVEEDAEGAQVHAYRFDGDSASVREKVGEMTHGRE